MWFGGIAIVVALVLGMLKMATGTVDTSLEPLHYQKQQEQQEQQAKIEAAQEQTNLEESIKLEESLVSEQEEKIQEIRQENRE